MENRLARLVLTYGVQGMLAAIGDACAVLAAHADNNGRHDIAVALRKDEATVFAASHRCKVWDLSGLADYR